MKKKFLACALLASAIPFTAAFGCSQNVKSIVSIEKSESIGLVDYYTITYSDGTTSAFTVTNGKDGADGQDAAPITLDDLYEYCLQLDADITKEQFLEKFIADNDNLSADALSSLPSPHRYSVRE